MLSTPTITNMAIIWIQTCNRNRKSLVLSKEWKSNLQQLDFFLSKKEELQMNLCDSTEEQFAEYDTGNIVTDTN